MGDALGRRDRRGCPALGGADGSRLRVLELTRHPTRLFHHLLSFITCPAWPCWQPPVMHVMPFIPPTLPSAAPALQPGAQGVLSRRDRLALLVQSGRVPLAGAADFFLPLVIAGAVSGLALAASLPQSLQCCPADRCAAFGKSSFYHWAACPPEACDCAEEKGRDFDDRSSTTR